MTPAIVPALVPALMVVGIAMFVLGARWHERRHRRLTDFEVESLRRFGVVLPDGYDGIVSRDGVVMRAAPLDDRDGGRRGD